MTTDQSMLTARAVAEWLGVHVNTVKRLGDRGEIPFYRISARGDRRYRPEDIRAYLEAQWREGLGYGQRDADDGGGTQGERKR